jgi:bla regulator protein BlaR1
MENILYNISQVLGISIIHSLWQGLLIYFLLRVIMLFTAWLPASNKYLLAVSSLLAITGWFVYTLIHEIQVYDWLAKPSTLANMPLMLEMPANLRHFNDATIRYYYSIEKYLPYVTAIYVLGLMLNMMKVVLAHRKIGTIKRTMSIGIHLQQQISEFAQKLSITKKVQVGLSHMVDVPCIVGFLKPVILLPITLSTYLEAEEIEAILMHELAHIKRNDYLINLLQQVITTLLFFNPCVLLINKIISEERENSCDDLVVNGMQKPVVYAKALFKLEQTRQNDLQLALAVTGKKYHLLNRIERIMKTKKQMPSIRPTLVAMLILILGVSSLALLNPQIAQGKISVKAITPEIMKGLVAPDTVPAKKYVKAKSAKSVTKAQQAVNAKSRAEKDSKKAYGYNNNNNNNNYSYNGFNDPELERLSKEVERHGNAIGKYYDSQEFKARSEELEKLGKQLENYYNSDKVKNATEAQKAAAANFEKAWAGKGAQLEQFGKQMSGLGDQISKYYNSKEFKDLNARIAKKYDVNPEGYHNDGTDTKYRKYQDELQQNIPDNIKQVNKQMRDLGDQMRVTSSNPDTRKQQDEMRATGEDMRTAYNNPDMKATQERMRKIGDDMRNYNNNPQIKKEKELLQAASAKLRAYTQSPEFKKKTAEYRKTHPQQTYSWNDNEDIQKPEAPEKPEAPASPDNN